MREVRGSQASQHLVIIPAMEQQEGGSQGLPLGARRSPVTLVGGGGVSVSDTCSVMGSILKEAETIRTPAQQWAGREQL